MGEAQGWVAQRPLRVCGIHVNLASGDAHHLPHVCRWKMSSHSPDRPNPRFPQAYNLGSAFLSFSVRVRLSYTVANAGGGATTVNELVTVSPPATPRAATALKQACFATHQSHGEPLPPMQPVPPARAPRSDRPTAPPPARGCSGVAKGAHRDEQQPAAAAETAGGPRGLHHGALHLVSTGRGELHLVNVGGGLDLVRARAATPRPTKCAPRRPPPAACCLSSANVQRRAGHLHCRPPTD